MNKLTQKELASLARIYLNSRNRLLDVIVNYKGVGTKTYYNTVLQQLNRELDRLRRASVDFIDTAIPREYEQGLKDTYAHFIRNNLLMKQPNMWADIHTDAVYGIAREMQFHVDQGLAQVGRQVMRYADTARDQALRAAGLLTSGEKAASGATTIDMKNRLIEQLQAEGFMTVQYGSGPGAYQVSLDSYANMVARSTTREAGNIARENQLIDNGYDLVEMSEHYPTCEVCAALQGRVYSISGNDKRFPALSVAFSSGYRNVHPNCRHVIVPWIESLQTPEEVQAAMAKSNKPLKDTRSRQEVELYKKQQAQHRQARQDLYQYERYKTRLGTDAPSSYGAFRRLKHQSPKLDLSSIRQSPNRGNPSPDGTMKKAIVYHGTNADFTEFDHTKIAADKHQVDQYGGGFYFADTPEQAKLYGDNVYAVELDYSTDRRMAKKLGTQRDFQYNAETGIWTVPYDKQGNAKIIGKANAYELDKGFQAVGGAQWDILQSQYRAMGYYEEAVKNEPEITKTILGLADKVGMDVVGLDYRIKSKDSFLRKVANNYSTAGTTYEVKDIIRYTYTANSEALADKTLLSIEEFEKISYNTIEVKNYWLKADNPYNGVNTTIKAPNGQKFEMQYHTPESFALKNGKLHELYEKARTIDDKRSPEYIRLQDEMFALSEQLAMPINIERVKTR